MLNEVNISSESTNQKKLYSIPSVFQTAYVHCSLFIFDGIGSEYWFLSERDAKNEYHV